MRIFISGGCKNGKSFYAQRLAHAQFSLRRTPRQAGSLFYVATMRSVDSEDDERIARHRREREGWGFTTIEQPFDIEEILEKCSCGDSLLLDSLTALLANEMFPPGGKVNDLAAKKIAGGLRRVTDSVKNIVIISDFIYSDALLFDPLTEKYREQLARIDRAAAAACDVVLEIAYTNMIVHKGRETFGELYEKIL